jgi:release factor glutamine methyltransferase
MTIAELKISFEKELKGLYSSTEIKNFFTYVLSHLLQVPKLTILSQPDKELGEKITESLPRILLELKKKAPIQYILGKADFYGMVLEVNPYVLIPRPETEELVDWIIKEQKGKKISILDVCTGSGCIALALRKNVTLAKVKGVDISAKALEVAKGNSLVQKLDVDFIEADALKLDEVLNPSDYDVIVSNPPYVLPDEKKTMRDNVLKYEPHLALFVPENDPLLFYRAIAEFVKRASHNVTLYFEINETKADLLAALFKEMGFKDILVKKDINGKDRMLKCTYIC